MTALGEAGSRLPLGDGQHVVAVRRDRPGQDDHNAPRDRRTHAHAEGGAAGARSEGRPGGRRADAAARGPAGVPFVLFDSQDPRQRSLAAPVGLPATVSPPARLSRSSNQSPTTTTCCAATSTSSARSCTPPMLAAVDPAPDRRVPTRCNYASAPGDRPRRSATPTRRLKRRVDGSTARYVASRKGNEDLSGGVSRLEVALALAGRDARHPACSPPTERRSRVGSSRRCDSGRS